MFPWQPAPPPVPGFPLHDVTGRLFMSPQGYQHHTAGMDVLLALIFNGWDDRDRSRDEAREEKGANEIIRWGREEERKC